MVCSAPEEQGQLGLKTDVWLWRAAWDGWREVGRLEVKPRGALKGRAVYARHMAARGRLKRFGKEQQ